MVIFFFLFIIFFVFTSIVIKWYKIPSGLPPGPLGLPLIGSGLETWKASTLIDVLNKWKIKYGSLYKLYVGEKLVVVLADYKMIHEALVKQGDVFSGRPTFHTILLRKNVRIGKLCTLLPQGQNSNAL